MERVPRWKRLLGITIAAAINRLAPADLVAQEASIRFMTLDPGHFHAALIHKEMYPGVSPRIDIYAPLGFDLSEHLARIQAFNRREADPTRWELEIHPGGDPFARMLREKPGNVVVIAGRNAKKMDYVSGSVAAGLHVLADKPWIVRSADLPRLEQTLEEAERRGLVAYDVMTERYEVTNALQRELVNDPAVFGSQIAGTPQEPGVTMRSVHHILKTVAGAPLRRPLWWFDPAEQGEALSDVGTHLVDLAMWTLFPGQALDRERDVALHSARAWRTMLSREQWGRVTGESDFPASVARFVEGDSLGCECNTQVAFSLRGVAVKLDVLWAAESDHADTHDALYRGTTASIEVRQGAPEGWLPQVYVVPADPARRSEILAAVRQRVAALQGRWPGLQVAEQGEEIRLVIPDAHRLGHERHFAEVAKRFLEYLQDPSQLPAWERPNMLVKYHISTLGTEMSHQAQ